MIGTYVAECAAMRFLLASVLALAACADNGSMTDDPSGDGKADGATKDKVVERAKDLGVELGLAVPETRDNLEIQIEDTPVNYRSEATLNTTIATLYWVKITMDTVDSHDFVRAAIVNAPRMETLAAEVVQPEMAQDPVDRRDGQVDDYARDLGIAAGLAVEATRQNLEVTFERELAHYQSESTLNTRVATAHFTQVAMTTAESHDFARYIIIDSARLPSLVSIPVQLAIE